MDKMYKLYFFTAQHQLGANKIHAVFLNEGDARAFVVSGMFGDTYERMLETGGVAVLEVSPRAFQRFLDSGVVYLSFGEPTSTGYPVPRHASANREGLVSQAVSAKDMLHNALERIKELNAAGAFLIDGYRMPAGYARAHACSGALIEVKRFWQP